MKKIKNEPEMTINDLIEINDSLRIEVKYQTAKVTKLTKELKAVKEKLGEINMEKEYENCEFFEVLTTNDGKKMKICKRHFPAQVIEQEE